MPQVSDSLFISTAEIFTGVRSLVFSPTFALVKEGETHFSSFNNVLPELQLCQQLCELTITLLPGHHANFKAAMRKVKRVCFPSVEILRI